MEEILTVLETLRDTKKALAVFPDGQIYAECLAVAATRNGLVVSGWVFKHLAEHGLIYKWLEPGLDTGGAEIWDITERGIKNLALAKNLGVFRRG